MTTVHGPARARTSPKTTRAPHERRLRVVRTSARARPRAPFIVLVVALMALGLVGLLLINTTMQRGAFELTELRERADTLQTREQALQLEVASMSSPDRIATRAARFGMVPNASPAFLRLSDGEVVGQPSPALPGTNLPGISRTNAQRRDDDRNRGSNRNQDRDNNGAQDAGRNGNRDRDNNGNRGNRGDRDADRNGNRNRDNNDRGERRNNDQRNRDGQDRRNDPGGE